MGRRPQRFTGLRDFVEVELDGAMHGTALPVYKATEFYWGRTVSQAPANNHAMSAGRIVYTPFYCKQRHTFDRIAVWITSAAAGGTEIRMGIYYADAANRYPGTLLLDAGVVAADATGLTEITISQELLKGGLYWLAALPEGTPSIAGAESAPLFGSTPVSKRSFLDGVPTWGALPNPGSGGDTTGDQPAITLRA